MLSSSLSSSWLTALAGGSDSDPPFFMQSCPLQGALYGAPQSLSPAAFYTSWPAGFSGHGLFFESGLFSGRAAVCMQVPCSAMPLFPTLKKFPYGTHTIALSLQPLPGSLCTPLPPNGKNSFSVRAGHSLLVPSKVLGVRISLLDSSGWCCSHGHADPVFVLPKSPSLHMLSQFSPDQDWELPV